MRIHQAIQTAAQITIAQQGAQQIAQLSALNQQMAQQNARAAMQANLSQVLFETEQMVRRVQTTRGPDLFAAAVLAEQRLKAFDFVDVADFHTIGEKRSWHETQSALAEVSRSARAYPELAQKLDTYHSVLATFGRLGATVRGDSEAYVAAHRAAVAAADPKLLSYVTLVSVVLFVTTLVLTSVVSNDSALESARALSFVGAIGGAVKWKTTADTQSAARRTLEVAERQAHEWEMFLKDPRGGAWLTTIWAQHVYLNSEPPMHALPGQGGYSHGYRHSA